MSVNDVIQEYHYPGKKARIDKLKRRVSMTPEEIAAEEAIENAQKFEEMIKRLEKKYGK